MIKCFTRPAYCQAYGCYLDRLAVLGKTRKRRGQDGTVVHGILSHEEYHLIHSRADDILRDLRATNDMEQTRFTLDRIYWLLALPAGMERRT